MTEAVIAAVITALGSIVCQILINRKNAKERTVEEAVRQAKLDSRLEAIDKRLDGLEKRIDSHNGYAKMFADTKGDIQEMKISIVSITKDIEYLRNGTEHE